MIHIILMHENIPVFESIVGDSLIDTRVHIIIINYKEKTL